MRAIGKIASWNDEKGFGFITPSAGGKQTFVHIKAFSNRSRRPEINQVVSYSLSSDRQGRPCAVNATLAGDRLPQTKRKKNGALPIAGATLFLVFVVISVVSARMPALILGVYLAASLLAFFMYAVDKSAARSGAWRTSEGTLHLLSLAGGWPGALVAQQVLRHKTRKQSFRSVFWVTVILNCALFVWLLTPTGTDALRSYLPGLA